MEHELAIHPDKFAALMLEKRQKHFLLKHKLAYHIIRKLSSGFALETRAYARCEQRALWDCLHQVMDSNLPVFWYKKRTPDALQNELGRHYWVFELMSPSQVKRYEGARGFKQHNISRTERFVWQEIIMKMTHTAQITLVSMNGSLGMVTAEFEIMGTRRLDAPQYLDSVVNDAYKAVLEKQGVTLQHCGVNIGGMYSANQFHRYVCSVAVSGETKDGERGHFNDELHIYVDRSTMTPIEEE